MVRLERVVVGPRNPPMLWAMSARPQGGISKGRTPTDHAAGVGPANPRDGVGIIALTRRRRDTGAASRTAAAPPRAAPRVDAVSCCSWGAVPTSRRGSSISGSRSSGPSTGDNAVRLRLAAGTSGSPGDRMRRSERTPGLGARSGEGAPRRRLANLREGSLARRDGPSHASLVATLGRPGRFARRRPQLAARGIGRLAHAGAPSGRSGTTPTPRRARRAVGPDVRRVPPRLVLLFSYRNERG